MEFVNKITMKAIGCQPRPHSVDKPVELAHIYGVAREFRTGSSNYGFYDKFMGDLEATNLETGEVFVGRSMLLPAVAEAMLKEALISVGAEAGKVGQGKLPDTEGKVADVPVEFGFIIGAKPNKKKTRDGEEDKSGQGYEWTVKTFTPSKRSDALAHLRQASEGARKALPAPGKGKVA